MNTPKILAIAVSAALLAACGSDDNNDSKKDAPKKDKPAVATYNFESKLKPGESSVSYSGQVARNTLINELKVLIGTDMTQDLGGLAVDAAVKQKLALVYEGGTNGGTASSGNADLTTKNAYTLAAETTKVGLTKKTAGAEFEEADYKAISSGKNLFGKIAGKDNALARGEFVGWTFADGAVENDKANTLVQSWFNAIAANAKKGDAHPGKDYVSVTGLDYQQLTQKFLLGAVAFSQVSNDYLKADKGLLKQNKTGAKGGTKSYTDLEHQWDEGFGYFGAARDYNKYTDTQLKSQKDNDSNGDKKIDLDSEYTFSMAQYASKRDLGIEGADYSKTIMDTFLKGRKIIQDNFGTDPVAGQGYHKELESAAKLIIMQWEEIFAANVIHYINETLKAMEAINGDNIGKLPKYWSEMKGFALALQFNPEKTSAMTLQNLKDLHGFMGNAPKLTNDAAYRAELVKARDLLKTTFKFQGDVTKW